MGPKDLERIEENKAERLVEKENKANRRFEELKNEKIAEKFGKKDQPSDEAMLEWIELNKQLRIDKDTGKPYADRVTASDKSKSMFLENPLIPIGNYRTQYIKLMTFVQETNIPVPNDRYYIFNQYFAGMFATLGSLLMGLKGFMRGSPNQRFWMWARIGAQGGTVFAMLGGAIMAANKHQKPKNAVSTHNP